MGIQEILIRRIRNDLHIHWSFNISVDYANQKWVEMVMMIADFLLKLFTAILCVYYVAGVYYIIYDYIYESLKK